MGGVGPVQYPPSPGQPDEEREPDAAKKRREARDKGSVSNDDFDDEKRRIEAEDQAGQ